MDMAGQSGAATAAANNRKAVASTFVILEGYMVGPNEDMSWVIEGFDWEMQDDIRDALSERTGTILLGRVTYDIFANCWPSRQTVRQGRTPLDLRGP